MNHPRNVGAQGLIGLYPIVDLDRLRTRAEDPLCFAQALLGARPRALQVRAKATPVRETLRILEQLLPECHAAGTLLFANDRPDLAVLAGCDGVHVGQLDLPIEEVRRFAPHLLVGVSTHNLTQLSEALIHQPDYVAFGPVFATGSKQDPDPVVGAEQLERAHEEARSRGVPLVAIGGITLAHVAQIKASAEMVAVIAALMPADAGVGPLDMAQSFQRALLGSAFLV